MPKRSRKPVDLNELARSIVEQATNPEAKRAASAPAKNPAAVELGRLGGKKGGPARAKALSKKKRSAIAKKAAEARWKQRPKPV
jgi:hypothetical protein